METDIAYLAGFFDGEGCISVAKERPYIPNREVNPTYQLYVTASNCDIRVLKKFKGRFKGGFIRQKSVPPHCRHCYVWKAMHRQASKTLTTLYPYLITKKVQAKYGVILQTLKLKRPHRRWPTEMLEIFEKIRDKVMEANHHEFENSSD